LRALELRARIKEPALFAAMQFGAAPWTLPGGVKSRDEHRAAVRATRSRYRTHHPGRARPEMIGGSSWAALWWFTILSVSFFVLFLFFGITIAAVTVLAIHKRLRPSVSTDCNYALLHNNPKKVLFLTCIQSDCFKRPANQPSPLKLSWIAVQREQKMGQLCL
jgi:hypothetical protein